MKSIEGKFAVVTGASSGIGLGIGKALAAAGARVLLLASNAEKLAKAVAEIEQAGGQASAMACNLMDVAAFTQVYEQLVAEQGVPDIWVNNVGAGTFKPMHHQTQAEAMLPVQLPFGISVAACQLVVPQMLERGSGHLVNLISPAGLFPLPFMMPYTAARWGITGLSHALWEELHHQGIGVTLVCPSQVNTGYFDNNDADMGWYPKLSNIFPVLEPEDVGAAVVKGILKDRREMIIPGLLRWLVAFYRPMPRVWVRLFKWFGLWGPSRKL